MRINGDTDKLGNWNKGQPVLMSKGPYREWLTGELVQPWEICVRFSRVSFPPQLVYKYSLWNELDDTVVWEREPSRYLVLQDPSDYDSDQDQMWRNRDKGFLVNGLIYKLDANFVGSMTFDMIGDTGIFLGPYP